MARFLLLALALVGCGKVTDPDAVDGSIHGDGTGLDARVPVTKPVAKLTTAGVAGASATCSLATASTGPGTITYVATWSLNGLPFTNATTTTLPNDTLPSSISHTGDVVACSLFASNGTDGALSDPASATMSARTAFLAERDGSSPATNGLLVSIDLDTLQPTTIGRFGVGFVFGDLAWDAQNQILYMVDGQAAKTLYTVDITTGKATAVGAPHGLSDMRGLAVDPTNSKLFGALGSSTNSFFLLNTTSGAATQIGGSASLDGLVFDTKRSLLMGLVASVGGATVATVDESTGKTTNAHTITGVNNCGMTYDAFTDKLVAADDDGNIVEIDPANGFTSFTRANLAGALIDGIAIKLPKPE